jgi:predicted ATPase
MKWIKIKDYRCFEQLDLEFADQVNLLIGDNASGKTTLVRAVSTIFNGYINNVFPKTKTGGDVLTEADYRKIETELGLEFERDILIKFFLAGESGLMTYDKPNNDYGENLSWFMHENKEIDYPLQSQVNNRMGDFPVFASFTKAQLGKKVKVKDEFDEYKHKPTFGYFLCFQADELLSYWTKRLLVLREANTAEIEVKGVIQAIKTALGPDGCDMITDVEIRPIKGKVYYRTIDGRYIETSHLSDGLLRLVNIVMDLAFRCMLLNQGVYGEKATLASKGTVVIDEIDLHLHPSLQSKVIKGLSKAFPKLQFIITTHAPLVMSGVEYKTQNKIIQLGYKEDQGYTSKEVSTYGMDASTIIETVLGISPRAPEVKAELDHLFDLLDSDQLEKALTELTKLRMKYGNDLPELAKAETMYYFLNELFDDKDNQRE